MRDSYMPARRLRHLLVLAVALCAVATLLVMPHAHATDAAITVVNNSDRELIHIYLAHADRDDWGANQLGNATIPTGQSFTVTNVSCDQAQIKVVAEDRNGCFLTAVVACGSAATWTVTNDTPADCGN